MRELKPKAWPAKSTAMIWTKIKPYDDSETLYWISGIYKVKSYDGEHFHAYFIQDFYKNWGDNPSPAPCYENENGYHSRFWPSLESAQEACEMHARTYTPQPTTVRRAGELLNKFMKGA